jgi:hypothetical protein
MKTRISILAAGLMGVALWAGGALAQTTGSPFLDHLHSDLQLNASQESAWQSFQQAYRVDPQDLARERDAQTRMPTLNGPQRMDLAIGMAEQDLAGMRQRSDALKTFYATLSAQQQHVFDRDTLEPSQ